MAGVGVIAAVEVGTMAGVMAPEVDGATAAGVMELDSGLRQVGSTSVGRMVAS